MKKYARVAIASLLAGTGLLSAFARLRLNRKAVVLTYHRVLTNDEYDKKLFTNGIAVTVGTFEKQMAYLARNFRIVSPEEFCAHLRDGIPFEAKSCLVTFDDGWKDTITNALPILRKNGIPSLVFLSTEFIGSRARFWQERLIRAFYSLREYIMEHEEEKGRILSAVDIDGIENILGSDATSFREKVLAFTESQKRKGLDRVEAVIERLNGTIPNQPREGTGSETFLNWQDVGRMEEEGIRFGSHGKSHRILTVLNKEEVEKEVAESKDVIGKRLGKDICAFSYPNGDYSEQVMEAVRLVNYRVAFTTESGPVSVNDNRYSLRRRNIHEDMTDSIPMFLARVAGLW